jgi:hypothetical protein
VKETTELEGFRPGMLHVVEVRFISGNIRDVLLQIRAWCDRKNVRQGTFRYWLSERDSVVRVNFELEEEAQAFAQTFSGTVLA